MYRPQLSFSVHNRQKRDVNPKMLRASRIVIVNNAAGLSPPPLCKPCGKSGIDSSRGSHLYPNISDILRGYMDQGERRCGGRYVRFTFTRRFLFNGNPNTLACWQSEGLRWACDRKQKASQNVKYNALHWVFYEELVILPRKGENWAGLARESVSKIVL